ncbi:glycerophosphodiester phosphodiesterase family protein [Microbacterium sp. gxy059]|uniref:glycerophosphodiester phosphodiesterase family protein n=1 Tax=Microbacterium sp. gxy059 TaxID=2957199 RepID=UPI003D962B6E
MDGSAPLVIGHRGAPGYLPEHTRASYELAIAQGADAVEPDVVPTKDGVLVVRHENEISETTDVASRPEFADRRTTKSFAGVRMTGWFAEDFTWDELSTLRCRERIPGLRPESARHDGAEPPLRLRDVLAIARAGGAGVVVEIKHDALFSSLGFDLAAMTADEIRSSGWGEDDGPLVIESFEQAALTRIRDEGLGAPLVYLVEASGTAPDRLLAEGDDAPSYRDQLAPEGLAALADGVDGISVHKRLLLDAEGLGAASGFVEDARARGLSLFTWTCRPENAFLLPRHRSSGGRAAHGDWRAEWREIARAEPDGVFVDHADLGVAAFRSSASTRA